jgi:hypothetical protein
MRPWPLLNIGVVDLEVAFRTTEVCSDLEAVVDVAGRTILLCWQHRVCSDVDDVARVVNIGYAAATSFSPTGAIVRSWVSVVGW